MKTGSVRRSGGSRFGRVLAIGRCVWWLGAAGSVVACAAAVAPQELHNARHAYTQASQGPAAQLAPAQLDTARQGLERANMAFGSGADEAVVRDLAYIAERQVAMAVSAAALEQANRGIEQYQRDKEELQRALQRQTELELSRMKQELEAQKRAIASEREARLEAERQAEAERNAAAALDRLSGIARVTEEARGIVITLSGSSLFGSNQSSSLLPVAKATLKQVADALLEQGDAKIIVEAHTDSRGSAVQNQEVSALRAREVRGYLISQGIPTANIQASGIGEERPVASNDTAEGRANNRRVEIVVSPKPTKSKT